MIETGLLGKTVIVTGAASGIGRATAVRFAREGAKVVGWDVNVPAQHELAQFLQVDVTDTESVNRSADAVVAQFGSIHTLVNNAGILRDGQLVKVREGRVTGVLPDDQFDAVISVNLRGVFACTRAVAPHMIAAGGGVILNASSVVGLYGNFGQTNYIATKAGVIGMTKVWARELGRYGIRVNAVAPGFIATEMVQAMPEKILQTMVEHTPLRRLGKPEEIAETYLWLASGAASFVTGAVISVDGGVVTGT
jgi:3-oxoacyl-[acyl-carrier protein] reductase